METRMNRNRLAKELVSLAKGLTSGLYGDVASSTAEEIAGEYAAFVMRHGFGHMDRRAKVVHRGNRVLVSGQVAKSPGAVAVPEKEGQGLGLQVDFELKGEQCWAEFKIWVGGRLVDKSRDVSRRGDTVEKWIANLHSNLGHLIYVSVY